MKKILITVIVILPSFLYAQLEDNEKVEQVSSSSINNSSIYLGVDFGVSLFKSRLKYQDTDYSVPDVGYNMGYSTNFKFCYNYNEKISFVSKVGFVRKGHTMNKKQVTKDYDYNDTLLTIDYSGNGSLVIDYVNLSAMVQINIKNIHFYAGPYISYGINAKRKYDLDYSYGSGNNLEYNDEMKELFQNYNEIHYNFESSLENHQYLWLQSYITNAEIWNMKQFDYGIDLGINFTYNQFYLDVLYSFGISNRSIDVTNKYYYGELTDMQDDVIVDVQKLATNYQAFNSGLILGLGYYFRRK